MCTLADPPCSSWWGWRWIRLRRWRRSLSCAITTDLRRAADASAAAATGRRGGSFDGYFGRVESLGLLQLDDLVEGLQENCSGGFGQLDGAGNLTRCRSCGVAWSTGRRERYPVQAHHGKVLDSAGLHRRPPAVQRGARHLTWPGGEGRNGSRRAGFRRLGL